MKFITFMAICVDICIENNNNILKILLYDYIKLRLTKSQLFLFYMKVASIDKESKMYKLMNKWINKNSNILIKQFLYEK